MFCINSTSVSIDLYNYQVELRKRLMMLPLDFCGLVRVMGRVLRRICDLFSFLQKQGQRQTRGRVESQCLPWKQLTKRCQQTLWPDPLILALSLKPRVV